MATQNENFTTSNLMNHENPKNIKKKDNYIPTKPKSRAALVDLGNKLVNKTCYDNKNANVEKSLKNKLTKPTGFKPLSGKTEINPTSKKIIQRQESILHSTLSVSNPRLKIYNPDEGSKDEANDVVEYLEDIFPYLRELERKFAIKEEFLSNHKTTPSMRAVLVNWLVDLQINFKLTLETFHLCIGIMDRYLQENKTVGRETLQLVGVSSLLIASKLEEVFIPEIGDFVYVCDDAFSSKQILAMERDILSTLDFNLNRPTSIHFLRRYSKIARVSAMEHNLSKYLIELAPLDYNLCHILPSYQAAAACCLSIGILREEMDLTKVWTPTLEYYTTYKLQQFRYVIVMLAHLLVKIETSKHQSTKIKYAAANLSKISTHYKLKGPLVMKLSKEIPKKKN